MREGRPERVGGRRDVRGRVEERVAEDGLVARRQLALDLAAGGGGGEPVELVEQARDRRPCPPGRTRSPTPGGGGRTGTAAARAGSTSPMVCAAAPTPFEVDIFLPPMLRNSYGKLSGGSRSNTSRAIAFGAVARPAGRREVLAVGLDRDAEQAPLGRPLEVPGQLRGPAERRDPPGPAAADRPRHEVRAAGDRRPSRRPSRTRSSCPTLPQSGRPRPAAASGRDAGRWPRGGRCRARRRPGRARSG